MLASALVSFGWLAAASTWTALGRATARTAAREPVFAESEDTGGTRVRDRFDVIDGRQFTVRWIAPEPGAPDPPGVDLDQLEQRRFVVSPALAKALRASGSARFAHAGLISPSGVSNPDELLAYGHLAAPASTDGWPIVGFGRGGTDAEVEPFPFAIAGLVFLIGPGLLLLYVALSVRSSPYTYRCQLLSRLGVGRRQIAAIGSIEAAIVATTGSVVGMALHHTWGETARAIPIVGRHVNPGDLALGPLARATTIALVTLGAMGIGGAIAIRQSLPTSATRPSATSRSPRLWHLMPLGAGLAALLATMALSDPQFQIRWMLVAGLLILVGIPLSLPFVGAGLGHLLAERSSLVAAMAGRRLEHDPRSAMRPLLLTSSALAIGLSVVGYVTAVGYEDPPAQPGDLQVAMVRYPRAVERAVHQKRHEGFALVPFDATTWRIGATCPEVVRAIHGTARICEDDETLSQAGRALIAQALTSDPLAAQALRLGPVETTGDHPSASLAIGPAQPSFSEHVRAALERYDAAEVTERVEASIGPEPVLARWLIAGFTIAAVGAVASLCLLTVERYGQTIGDHRVLGVLGIPPSVHWRLEALQFATCASLAAGLAYGAGATFAVVMTSTAQVEVPVEALIIAGALVGAGVVGCTTAVAAIAKIRLRNTDRIGRWSLSQ